MSHFSQLIKSYYTSLDILKGDIIEGVVKAKLDNFLLVDVGYKSYIWYPLSTESENILYFKRGTHILLYVDQISSIDGELLLNHNKAYKLLKFKNIWTLLLQNKHFVNGIILNHVSGGYSVGIGGLIAFLPHNQLFNVKYKNYLIGTQKTFSIINVNLYKKNIVLSRIHALEKRSLYSI